MSRKKKGNTEHEESRVQSEREMTGELSDSELEAVAGGIRNSNGDVKIVPKAFRLPLDGGVTRFTTEAPERKEASSIPPNC